MRLIANLEAGRREFLDAVRETSAEQAGFKPVPEAWSILECIEHVATVESRYLHWIDDGISIAPQVRSDRELRLFTTARSRLTRVESPEVLHPQGRFTSLEAAVAEFELVRSRTVQLVQRRGENLYAVGVTHPYFGKLNGVEMIRIIDGHALRHADQIREIGEALRKAKQPRMTRTPAPKKLAFKRDSPDLPSEFQAMEDPNPFANEFVTIQETHLQDFVGTNLRVNTFHLEGSALERVKLSDAQFSSVVWKDVRLIGCDLANILAHRIVFNRVELIDCRMTGFSAKATEWQDVLIQNGDLRYAQFQGGVFRTCEFVASNLQETDLQNADLSGSVLRACKLERADLNGAKLQNTDFRRSELEGMQFGMSDIRGAIVDPAQAMILARVLGLQIL